MKILVCTDGSVQSKKAAEEAAKIAGNMKEVEVSILSVCDEPEIPDVDQGFPMDIRRQLMECKHNELEGVLREAEELFKEKNIEVNKIIKDGHVVSVILDTIKETGAELVVMGAHGKSGFKGLFLGSVGNAVAQRADANVLLVK